MPSTCPRCGAVVIEDSQFCEGCGAALVPASATPGPPAAGDASSGAIPAGAAPTGGPPAAPPGQPDAYPPNSPPGTYQRPEAPAVGPYYSYGTAQPPTGAGPRRRLSTPALAGTIAVILLVAVGAGVAVPQVLKHNPPPAVPTTTPPTTTPPAPTTSTVPTTPTTAPATPTTTPATTQPTSAPTTSSTPPTTGGGNTASNSVVSVTLPNGWSVDSTSTSTDLFLDGPSNVFAEFFTQQEQASATLTGIFQQEVNNRLQKYPDTRICKQPTSATVPNGPPGEEMAVCFTVTPQNGPAVPYVDFDFAGLAGGDPLLVENDIYAPRTISGQALANEVGPLLQSVRWPQLTGGNGGGGGGGGGGTSGGATSQLVGDWLGPFPGPPGSCGKEYGEWFLYSTGSYTFTSNSQRCGGFTLYGQFGVQGNVITFHQQANPGCPTCAQSATFSVTFSFVTGGALRLCDTSAGGSCYVYYRQH